MLLKWVELKKKKLYIYICRIYVQAYKFHSYNVLWFEICVNETNLNFPRVIQYYEKLSRQFFSFEKYFNHWIYMLFMLRINLHFPFFLIKRSTNLKYTLQWMNYLCNWFLFLRNMKIDGYYIEIRNNFNIWRT